MRAAAARRRVAHLVETTSPSSVSGAVVVVGGMVMDVRASPFPGHSLTRGTTCPGRVRQTPGGVGRNIAEGVVHIAPPGAPHPFLISAVGDDLAGGALLQAWRGLFDTTSGGEYLLHFENPMTVCLYTTDTFLKTPKFAPAFACARAKPPPRWRSCWTQAERCPVRSRIASSWSAWWTKHGLIRTKTVWKKRRWLCWMATCVQAHFAPRRRRRATAPVKKEKKHPSCGSNPCP